MQVSYGKQNKLQRAGALREPDFMTQYVHPTGLTVNIHLCYDLLSTDVSVLWDMCENCVCVFSVVVCVVPCCLASVLDIVC